MKMVANIKKSELNRALLKAVARTYYKELLKNIPGKGRLADALDIMTVPDGVLIYADDEKAGEILNYLNFGTQGPYPIRPKNKQALSFFAEGEYVVTKKVVHPGIEARLFVQSVMNNESTNEKMQAILEQEIKKIVQK